MLYQRALQSVSKLRWLMSDSSTQHGRSFQLTSILSLATDDVGKAFRCANELRYLWLLPLVQLPIVALNGAIRAK
eukprot:2509111-Amphidinium_carterae.1